MSSCDGKRRYAQSSTICEMTLGVQKRGEGAVDSGAEVERISAGRQDLVDLDNQ